MTRPDLDAIRARAEAATEGPWEADDNQPFSFELQGIFAPTRKRYVLKVDFDEQPENMSDAEFIAASRTDVPDLLAYIEQLEARIDTVRTLAERWAGDDQPPLLRAAAQFLTQALEGELG